MTRSQDCPAESVLPARFEAGTGNIADAVGLGKIIALYDDNHITIDGAFSVV